MRKVKAVFVQAREVEVAGETKRFKVGEAIELPQEEFLVLADEGLAVTAKEYEATQALKRHEDTIRAARTSEQERQREALKAKVDSAKERGAVAPKDEVVLQASLARLAKYDSATADQQKDIFDVLAEQIDGLKSSKQLKEEILTARITDPDYKDVSGAGHVQLQGVSPQEAGKAYIKASEPINKLVLSGNVKDATHLSRESGLILASHLMPLYAQGGDILLRDIIRGADYSDPNSQVGTLATGLVLMRNLGYLKNRLNWLPYFTTDLRNEPALFGQNILTRYIVPPNVATWVPGVGFTTDSTTISNASATAAQSGLTTQTSGTETKSAPSTPDRNVELNQYKATPIEFPISTLAATLRNLFAEQRSAQMYSLAEHINQFVLGKIFASTWSGAVTRMSIENIDLKRYLTLKNRMELNKIPDFGRYALMHSTFADGLMADGNLLTTKAIMALINKDASAFEGGEAPPIFGVKPLSSQLAVGTIGSATLGTPSISEDGESVTYGTNNAVGFAGNMSSMLFVARVPQDFTKASQQLGIPATNAVEVVTEPDSGLSVMVFKYVDNGKLAITTQAMLMYGAGQGHPKTGFILTPTVV